MGERGPAPTPRHLLQLRGSWRGNVDKSTTSGDGITPRVPRWLSKEAKSEWRAVVPKLASMGLLSSTDGNALARYCTMLVRWRRASEFIEKNGETYVSRDAGGQVKGVRPFPQVRIVSELADKLLKIEAQFGLSPSARARVQTHAKVERPRDSSKERFFND